MARLQNNRRPLVVSFRRKTPTQQPQHRAKQVLFDLDLQEALDNLDRQPSTRYLYDHRDSAFFSSFSEQAKSASSASFVDAFNKLEPKHVCPLNADAYVIKEGAVPQHAEDIEIFHEQHFKVHKRGKRDANKPKDDIYERTLTKSRTMPPPTLFNQGDVSDITRTRRQSSGIWSCNKTREKSGSCSRLELITEDGERNANRRQYSDGIVIGLP